MAVKQNELSLFNCDSFIACIFGYYGWILNCFTSYKWWVLSSHTIIITSVVLSWNLIPIILYKYFASVAFQPKMKNWIFRHSTEFTASDNTYSTHWNAEYLLINTSNKQICCQSTLAILFMKQSWMDSFYPSSQQTEHICGHV